MSAQLCDTYTDVSTSWSVSTGTITDTVIVTDSGDTSKKVTGADMVMIALPGTFDVCHEYPACQCVAIETKR